MIYADLDAVDPLASRGERRPMEGRQHAVRSKPLEPAELASRGIESLKRPTEPASGTSIF